MTVRLLRQGQQTNIAEKNYHIDENDTKPVNGGIDVDGKIISGIVTGSTLIENLDLGGIKAYVYSEKNNSWNPL